MIIIIIIPILKTNNLFTVILFQVFLSNSSNFQSDPFLFLLQLLQVIVGLMKIIGRFALFRDPELKPHNRVSYSIHFGDSVTNVLYCDRIETVFEF